MADEAVVRIVMQSDGHQQPAQPAGASAPAPPTQSQLAAPKSVQPFDPEEEAHKRYEREQHKAQVDEAYKEMYGEEDKAPSLFGSVLGVAKQMRGTIGGQFGTAAGAMLDVASAVGNAGSTTGAAEGAGAAGAAGGAAGGAAVAAAAAAVVVAFVALNRATDEMVKKFEGYSAVLSSATAQADARSQLGDLRRAQEIGPKLAQFVDAQSKMEQSWEDIKVSIMQVVVPILTNIYEVLQPGIEMWSEILKIVSEILGVIYKMSPLKLLSDIVKLLRGSGEADELPFDPLLDLLVPNL